MPTGIPLAAAVETTIPENVKHKNSASEKKRRKKYEKRQHEYKLQLPFITMHVGVHSTYRNLLDALRLLFGIVEIHKYIYKYTIYMPQPSVVRLVLCHALYLRRHACHAPPT